MWPRRMYNESIKVTNDYMTFVIRNTTEGIVWTHGTLWGVLESDDLKCYFLQLNISLVYALHDTEQSIIITKLTTTDYLWIQI